MWKMDPMSGFDIRLVFTLPPRDSTLQYKRCVHFWNNFPCITSLGLMICQWSLTLENVKRCMLVGEIIISLCLKIQPLIQNDKWWPDPPFHSCMMKDLGGETINISTRNYEWRKNIIPGMLFYPCIQIYFLWSDFHLDNIYFSTGLQTQLQVTLYF